MIGIFGFFKKIGYISILKIIFWITVVVMAVLTSFQYKGNVIVYLIFSVTANLLLYNGFNKNSIFFETFMGLFLWLGFWFKLSIRLIIFRGIFYEHFGNFDGSGPAFDYALLVASCGMAGLLGATLLRRKSMFSYDKYTIRSIKHDISDYYVKFRMQIMIVFIILFTLISVSNVYLGIYQRGEITKTVLPFGLNGIYKWLLLFGLTSFSAVIVYFELVTMKKISFFMIFLVLLESFFTNISMISRGMIMNMSALALGILMLEKISLINIAIKFKLMAFLMFIFLFICSILLANKIRTQVDSRLPEKISHVKVGKPQLDIKQTEVDKPATKAEKFKSAATQLLLDRWVGIEAVMAITSYKDVGWKLWNEAWKEKYSENKIGFYDENIIFSPYEETDFSIKHYVTLPGIIAFCFYPASYIFLFLCMLLLGLTASFIEFFSFKLSGGNVIFSSLIGQVIAYRFANFGYVPGQSYLLVTSIVLNILIIYFIIRFLDFWKKVK